MLARASRIAALVALALLLPRGAKGDHGLGDEGAPIETNRYRIDLFQGPVLASSRVTGLAGAYSPIAEGVEGHAVNAASPAVRELWSKSWFDYDVSFGVTFPNALASTDFDNDGRRGFQYSNFVFYTFGLNVQLGNWGVGVSGHNQTYRLATPEAGVRHELRLARADVLLARSLFDGQLSLGVGARVVSLELVDGNGGGVFFKTASVQPQVGALFAPLALPVRFALTARGRMQPDNAQAIDNAAKDPSGHRYVEGVQRWYVPESVELPWEIEAGVAVQLGARPLNLPWVNPHHPPPEYLEEARTPSGEVVRVRNAEHIEQKIRARYLALPRQKVLLVGTVLVSGPVDDAVGVESFMRRSVQRSGRAPSVTPRLGVEAEPFADVALFRLGTYLEPSRFASGRPRLHGTFGIDVRLFRWDVFGLLDPETAWRAGGFADAAVGYVGWGLTLGVWR